MNYWEKRAIDSIKRMEETVIDYVPELMEAFENAESLLEKEINAFYGKHAKENKISLAEAMKDLDFAELKHFKGNLKEYERLARNAIGTYDLQVANLSRKARITRLQALEMECNTILQRLYQEQRMRIEGITTEVYTQAYYHNQFDLEQYTGFQFKFSNVSFAAIEHVLKQPVNGLDISTRLWRQDLDTGFRIRTTLNEMFITGKPPQFFAKELSKTIGRVDSNGNMCGKQYEAYRLLYNESAHALTQATLQSLIDAEIEEYVIIATLDLKTSDICRKMDGKHFNCKTAIPGENCPLFHVNCRTAIAGYIPEAVDGGMRMSRDPMSEKSTRVTKMDYDNWYDMNIQKYGVDAIKTAQENANGKPKVK